MQLDAVRIERRDGRFVFYSAPSASTVEDFDDKLSIFLCAAIESLLQRKAFADTQRQLARISRMTR